MISKNLSCCSSQVSSSCFSRFFCLWAILFDFLDNLWHCPCFDCDCNFVAALDCFESLPCSGFVVVLGWFESFPCSNCILGAVGSELSAPHFAVLSCSLISSKFLVVMQLGPRRKHRTCLDCCSPMVIPVPICRCCDWSSNNVEEPVGWEAVSYTHLTLPTTSRV